MMRSFVLIEGDRITMLHVPHEDDVTGVRPGPAERHQLASAVGRFGRYDLAAAA